MTTTCAHCSGLVAERVVADGRGRLHAETSCLNCGRPAEQPEPSKPEPEHPTCAGGFCEEVSMSNRTPYGRCPSCWRVVRCTVAGGTVLHREPTEYSEEQRIKGAFEGRFGLPAEGKR